MAKYGLLVDAQWCSGCHSCEIACQMEHGLPVGETGIKVVKIGPWAIGDEVDEDWQFSYLPIPTKQCDTCAKRRGAGKVPTCVQHCQSKCLEFGTIEELSARMDEKQKTLFVVA
ncbi:MAG: oxidoreductase [Coriobacteriia bacterium]|nr:oxidoreductase [Coriobacteriia bacterium]